MPRQAAPPKTLYYVIYTCGHWDMHWYFAATKDPCGVCRDMHAVTGREGRPVRVTRYRPEIPKARR